MSESPGYSRRQWKNADVRSKHQAQKKIQKNNFKTSRVNTNIPPRVQFAMAWNLLLDVCQELGRLGSLPQQRRVSFQPFLCLDKLWAKPRHLPPKTRRMVHFSEVCQFVKHNIIPHKLRCLDQTPIQSYDAAL